MFVSGSQLGDICNTLKDLFTKGSSNREIGFTLHDKKMCDLQNIINQGTLLVSLWRKVSQRSQVTRPQERQI